jgi:hypothetical protein
MADSPTPETLAWLRQCAALDGAVYPQVLLHLLDRVEVLEQESTCNQSLQVPSTPEAAPVATDEELCRVFDDGPIRFAPALRAVYDLGRQHGAVPAPVATNEQMREEWARICAMGKETAAAPPVAPVGALAARALLERVAAMADRIGAHTVGDIATISDRAAAWLRDNPPGQPVAIEPRGCPAPGACSCMEPAPPAAPAGGLVERVANAIGDGSFGNWLPEARAAIREVAAWLDQQGQHGCSLLLREDADR